MRDYRREDPATLARIDDAPRPRVLNIGRPEIRKASLYLARAFCTLALCPPNFRFTQHDASSHCAESTPRLGHPYAAWLAGADFCCPKIPSGDPLQATLIASPTWRRGPTIWNEMLRYAETNEVDFSTLRLVICGGASVPPALIERFQERHNVRIVQAWGMTETSPMGAIAHPPRGASPEEDLQWRTKTGRVVAGVELRIVDGEKELPWDGEAVGEIEVRGPWITGQLLRRRCAENSMTGGYARCDVAPSIGAGTSRSRIAPKT